LAWRSGGHLKNVSRQPKLNKDIKVDDKIYSSIAFRQAGTKADLRTEVENIFLSPRLPPNRLLAEVNIVLFC